MPLLETDKQAPSSLAAYTRANLVIPELSQGDTPGIISELSLRLQREGEVPDVLPFYHLALNRELLVSSALECGIALPHARLSGVRRLQFAFGRTAKPVNWGARSATPVQLVFLLAVPATDAARYLHLLSSLARLGQNAERLNLLRTASSTTDILHVLEQVPIHQGVLGAPA